MTRRQVLVSAIGAPSCLLASRVSPLTSRFYYPDGETRPWSAAERGFVVDAAFLREFEIKKRRIRKHLGMKELPATGSGRRA